jgi:hypothetical protein
MTHEPNGSKPGPELKKINSLTRINTIPSAEFTIPPPDSFDHHVQRCHSHRTQNSGAQEKESGNEGEKGQDGDEESLSTISDGPYPEGGLQAWLVVFGSFMGTTVAFGMM